VSWRSTTSKSTFTSARSYEHEVLFYAYSTTPYSTQLIPGAFQCDLPACYADTNLLDEQGFYGSANEKSVGFGTYDPDLVVVGQVYTAYMQTDKTTASSGMYKVTAQIGTVYARDPNSVNSEDTDILQPFSSGYLAPRQSSWRTEFEPNDSGGAYADLLNLGQWGTGWISSTTDQDFWKITPATSRNYRIVAKVANVNPSDYDIEIQNSSGTGIATGNKGANQDESIDIFLTAGQTYYIRVYSLSGSSTTKSYSVVYNGI
jgi:3D (Asp-Asp-Asp) domain-containing protein